MAEGQSGKRIVVVGGGPAGVFAAIEAKRTDPAAHVLLLTDEACEPYEKPPLSKAVLTGKALPEHALIAGAGGVAAHDVVLERTAVVTAIDRAAREVIGRRRTPLSLRRTGAGNRIAGARAAAIAARHGRACITCAPKPMRGRWRRRCGDAKHLVVVGGGLIGLEAAASATELGVRTTVLEVAPRILARVCDEETAAFITNEHRRHGIDLRTGATIVRREQHPRRHRAS